MTLMRMCVVLVNGEGPGGAVGGRPGSESLRAYCPACGRRRRAARRSALGASSENQDSAGPRGRRRLRFAKNGSRSLQGRRAHGQQDSHGAGRGVSLGVSTRAG